MYIYCKKKKIVTGEASGFTTVQKRASLYERMSTVILAAGLARIYCGIGYFCFISMLEHQNDGK